MSEVIEDRRARLISELEGLRARATEVEAEIQAIDNEAQRRGVERREEDRRSAWQTHLDDFVTTLRELRGQGVPVGMMAARLFVKKAVVDDLLSGRLSPGALHQAERDRLPGLVEEIRTAGVRW